MKVMEARRNEEIEKETFKVEKEIEILLRELE